MGVEVLTADDTDGDAAHARHRNRTDVDGHPINTVVVLRWGEHTYPDGGTIYLTKGPVDDPFVAFDTYDRRSVIENGIFKEGKQPWHLEQFPQRTETAVLVQCYVMLTVMALCTAFRLCQEAVDTRPTAAVPDDAAPTLTSALLSGEGTRRWRQRLTEEKRDHVIVFNGTRYGIFHLAGFAVLADLHLTALPPALGTSHDILTHYGLGP